MKSLIVSLFVAALALPLGATVVGRATIEQPLNLGSHADPARIPLAEVGTWSNNYYGIHEVIGAPRPLVHGAFGTPFGVELNANLASAFGISVEPEQSTLVYNCFTLHRVDNEANDLIGLGKIGHHPRTGEYLGYTWIDPHVVVPDSAPVPESDTRLVAAMCHAFVLTCRPAAAKPLRIRLSRSIEAFASHPAWQPVTDRTDRRDENSIECAFVWDPEKMQVSCGGTPGHHLERTKLGTWRVVRDPDAPVRDEPSSEATDQPEAETPNPH